MLATSLRVPTTAFASSNVLHCRLAAGISSENRGHAQKGSKQGSMRAKNRLAGKELLVQQVLQLAPPARVTPRGPWLLGNVAHRFHPAY